MLNDGKTKKPPQGVVRAKLKPTRKQMFYFLSRKDQPEMPQGVPGPESIANSRAQGMGMGMGMGEEPQDVMPPALQPKPSVPGENPLLKLFGPAQGLK